MSQKHKIKLTYLTIFILASSLISCAKDDNTIHSVVDLKTSFEEAKFDHHKPDVTVNLTGAHTGFGDITGPLWITLDFHATHPDSKVALIVDDYAYDVLKKMYDFKHLQDLDKLLNMEFISPKQAKGLEQTRYIFELFSGARKQEVQKNHPFFSDNTIRIVSDPMHGSTKDYVENKAGMRLYFNPPGIGEDRSGIVNNPDLKLFVKKTPFNRRLEAEKHFSPGIIYDIIAKKKFSNAKLSFLYGAHNTDREEYLRVQTTNYLSAVKRINSANDPLIVFTPNKVEILKKLVADEYHVYTPDELSGISALENKVYLVSIGAVSNLQFTSLLAIADVPLIIEGNSAMSTALRLGRPFIMYRSPWNQAQIDGIAHLEKNLDSSQFGDVYGVVPNKTPEFEHFMQGLVSQFQQEIYVKALDIRLPNFPARLASYIKIFEDIKEMDSISDANKREAAYHTKIDEIKRLYKDNTLEYSLAYFAAERKMVSHEFLAKEEQELRERGFDPVAISKLLTVKSGLKN